MDDIPLFAERPEWADITPLEQYDEFKPLAPIIYTPEYKDASNYFRGIVKIGEKSFRVLELTERMMRLNPAHYTAWQYRYETLLCLLFPSASESPLQNSHPTTPSGKAALLEHPLIINELTLMDDLATRFLKTYQVWHHRRLIVSMTGNWRRELEFIDGVFDGWEGDAKNYHTWSYRQWILGHFGGVGGGDGGDGDVQEEKDPDVWTGELDFVDSMISKDVRNNSAWHHRFFVVWGSGVREGEEDRETVLNRELTYSKQKISLAPNNPSAWNYLRGVLQATATPFSAVLEFVEPYTRPQQIDETTTDIFDLDNPIPNEFAELPCVEALEFLADIYEAQDEEEAEAKPRERKGVESAVLIWKSLAGEHDTIRKNYWQYRIRTAEALTSMTQSAQSTSG